MDLISANMTDSTLSISTNNGSGGFILAATCPVGNGSRFVTAADVNGDGRPDLISANWGDNTLTVLTNNGSGDFGFQSTITVGNGALFVAAADINGDGAVDLICANNTDYTLTVVTNSGGGGFILATNLSVGGNPNCVVALDVNGDGRLDLISASYQNNALIVWMNATPFLPFAPPGITAQPISITNLAGTTATFSVEASGGALAYQWQFNGTNLAVATNSLLILPNLAPSQAGSYSVLVSNALGSTNSLAATLTVLAYPPTITAQPTNQAVLVGGTAPFSVSASGTGPLSYQWAFNGLNIDGATSATLTLGNVQLTNAGNYSVVVTNTSGSILSSNALLTVNPAPANVPVITAFSPQSGADGTMVNITGFNFDPTPGNNTVHFGAVRAVVSAASTTNLVVDVPVGATFAPIAETVNGLTAYAGAPFLPTFPSSGTLTNSSLGSQITLPTGNGPGKALIADFDGDGKSDLAVNCGNYHTVYVYRNISTNGTLTAGSFAPPVVLQLGTGGEEEMAAADLTGDGKLDLVFLDYNFNAVGVLQNLCTPGSITTNSFGPRVNFAVGSGPVGVALQDLDGDGKPEIVTANLGGGTISVLRNLGTASMITTNSFAPAVNFAGPTSVRAVAIADMDGDGKPDVVALNWVSGSYNSAVSVFRNVSTLRNIAFASRVDFPGLSYCYKMAIGDMDEDGKLDAVFVSFAKGQSVSVYRNTGAPGNFTTNSFAPRVDFGLGGWGNGVTLGDLDGDGKPDVAAVTQSSSQLSLFRNISAPGSFSSSSLAGRLNFASGTNPYGVAIGDLDGDGRPEVVLVNNSAASISIYQNVVPFGGPPVVTTQPQCQTNVVGSTVSFGVVASGTVPLGYQW
ncbi:MAG: FG-GAP-like repeat-containing protein, partial [Verrucomicrobiota bacterium]